MIEQGRICVLAHSWMNYSFGLHGVDWVCLIGVCVAVLALKSATDRLK